MVNEKFRFDLFDAGFVEFCCFVAIVIDTVQLGKLITKQQVEEK